MTADAPSIVVGLMSGTSLDGIDAALVRVEGRGRATFLAFRHEPYATEVRDEILRAIESGRAPDLARLHVSLGERFAEAALALVSETGADVELVASHGQTVWHDPGRASLQLGDAAVIAERTGLPVASDFRARDVAAGGQGAPLVPIADVDLFGHPDRPRALLNVGGMANVTFVPRRGETAGVIAFDTGPGVAVTDALVRRLFPGRPFDEDGRIAAAGRAVDGVVDRLLAGAWFDEPPPRSTGRERFGETYASALEEQVRGARPDASNADVVATAVSLTARSVANAVARWLPDGDRVEVVVSGGGARHPGLMADLARRRPAAATVLVDDIVFDGDAKEAAAFAYLGWLTREGLPGNVPAATGAAGPRVLGHVTP